MDLTHTLELIVQVSEQLDPDKLRALPMDRKVKLYRMMREMKQDAERELKASLAGINKGMGMIEAFCLEQMEKDGTDSYKTPEGTAYRKTLRRVKLVDYGEFLSWAEKNDQLGMIQRRLVNNEVLQYFDNYGELPDGTKLDEIVSVNFQK